MDQELREHVIRLRRQGRDDALVEAKAAGGGVPKSVWQTISAFANTDGGLIILGLDEQTVRSYRGFDPQRILDALHSGLDDSHSADPKVLPIPPHDAQHADVDGAPVVTLRIGALHEVPGAVMPCFVSAQGIERGSYKRVGDANERLSPYETHLLRSRRSPDRTDRTEVTGTTPADLYLRTGRPHARRTPSPQSGTHRDRRGRLPRRTAPGQCRELRRRTDACRIPGNGRVSATGVPSSRHRRRRASGYGEVSGSHGALSRSAELRRTVAPGR